MLSESQIAQYHEDGYLIPNFRLSEQTLDDIKSAHARLIERHPDYVDYCTTFSWYTGRSRTAPPIRDAG